MSDLVHLAYSSAAVASFSDKELRTLLERARAKNSALGVTGILVHVDRSFLQVLEGSADAVVPLFDRIERDRRHLRVTKLIMEPIVAREFVDWSMALVRVTPQELAGVPGFSDFWKSRRSLESLGEGLARRVLTSFREDGRWRARVGT